MLAVLLAGAGRAADAAESKCRMLQIGELPITLEGGQITVAAEINGEQTRMVVDTGSVATILFRPSALRLGLTPHSMLGVKSYGVGGEDRAEEARVNTLQVGNLVAKNVDLLVTGGLSSKDVQGLLGAGFLLQSDVEFDVPEGKLRFFKPMNCVGDQVVYWGAAYAVRPIINLNSMQIEVMAMLNGVTMRAVMDSGASTSVVSFAGAAKAGVTPATQGVATSGSLVGIGPKAVASDVAVFSTFTFGDETIRNVHLRLADLFYAAKTIETGSNVPSPAIDEAQMTLGADFFGSHRVYVSRGQSKVYVSYMGGPVFATKAPPASATPPVTPATASPAPAAKP